MNMDASSSFLSFLDGQASWNNCLILATTNYPERLPGNIIDRPSRFDRVIRVDYPKPDVRKKYLDKMLGESNVDEIMIKKTEGFSIAYMKEICIQMMIHGKTFEEIMKETQVRKDNIKKYFAEPEINGDSLYG